MSPGLSTEQHGHALTLSTLAATMSFYPLPSPRCTATRLGRTPGSFPPAALTTSR
jgi:hypothetical protein